MRTNESHWVLYCNKYFMKEKKPRTTKAICRFMIMLIWQLQVFVRGMRVKEI